MTSQKECRVNSAPTSEAEDKNCGRCAPSIPNSLDFGLVLHHQRVDRSMISVQDRTFVHGMARA